MTVIKNCDGKTVCRADAKEKAVEIKLKDTITTIRFLDDGTIEVTNKAA
ncbi:MAG: hypothetical protein M0P14_00690 [Alkaliphilus sp.]|jgi:hypothetical protein|nr:hypothetical protein [Alkaliphilus sp.]